ncbi:MAG TPA: hypothetical protein VGN90_06060 [Pyrinomonadaceae bacterium]|nr:hypothetical protein [Pyrinomonadaceae bacterium]
MKKKRTNDAPLAPRTATWQKFVIVILCGVVAIMAIVFVVGLYQRWHSQGAYREAYAGRVMDKWVTYHETQQGTGISRHMLIKPKEGEAFEVAAGPELYEDVKVGRWIVKNKEGVKMSAAEP